MRSRVDIGRVDDLPDQIGGERGAPAATAISTKASGVAASSTGAAVFGEQPPARSATWRFAMLSADWSSGSSIMRPLERRRAGCGPRQRPSLPVRREFQAEIGARLGRLGRNRRLNPVRRECGDRLAERALLRGEQRRSQASAWLTMVSRSSSAGFQSSTSRDALRAPRRSLPDRRAARSRSAPGNSTPLTRFTASSTSQDRIAAAVAAIERGARAAARADARAPPHARARDR